MVEIKVIKPKHFNVMHPLNVPDRYEVGETYDLIMDNTVVRSMLCVPASLIRFEKCPQCPNFGDIEDTICGSCVDEPITFIDADKVLEGL